MFRYNFFLYWIFYLCLGNSCYSFTSHSNPNNETSLTFFCEKLSLSHFDQHERAANIQLHDEAFAVIQATFGDIKECTNTLLLFLHLSYKLANSFQQNSRGAEGEIVLSLASQALEKCFSNIHTTQSSQACKILHNVHPLLPSLYSAVLHYQSKSYFYRKSLSPLEDEKMLQQAEISLNRSLEIRKWIDQNLERCMEPLDSGGDPYYCSHTTLFFRTQGYIYIEKGDFDAARELYEKILETIDDKFEQILASLQLVKIYAKLAHQEWETEKIYLYYLMAYQQVQRAEFFLSTNNFSGYPSACLILAEFYSDKQNPYYNIIEAKNLLEKVIYNQRTFSQDRTIATRKKLAEIYEELAHLLKDQVEQFEEETKENYFARKTFLLSPFSSRIENVIGLASLYRRQKQFLQAALLISNALFQNNHPDQLTSQYSEKLWHQLYLVEKEFTDSLTSIHLRNPDSLTFSNYKASILRHKHALKEAREHFKQKLTLETCWETHQQLTKNFRQIYKKMFNEALSSFNPPPVPFAILGLGSLAREIPSPYSDLEFALVYSEEISNTERVYFDELSTSFLLKLIALGETPVHLFKWNPPFSLDTSRLEVMEGLRPDAGGSISHSFGQSINLKGTISELLQKAHVNIILQQEYSRAFLIFGSAQLFQSLQQQAQKVLLEATDETKIHFFWKDKILHTPPIIKINDQGQRCYSLKHSFLRGLIFFLYNLAWHHSILEKNPQATLEALENCGNIGAAQKEKIGQLIKKLLYQRSCHYLEQKGQIEDRIILDHEWDDFLDLIKTFNQVINLLTNKWSTENHQFDTQMQTDKNLIRVQFLHRAGYLQLAEKDLSQQLQSSTSLYELVELQGDNAFIQSKTNLAYARYQQALQLNPSNNLLHFKLTESALRLNLLVNAKTHLRELENELYDKKINDVIQLKIEYFKIIIARLEKEWKLVNTLLQAYENKMMSMSQKGNLIHALFEVEKGRFQNHLNNKLKAKEHFELAKQLIIRRYGPLHPSILPIYEELVKSLEPNEIAKHRLYHHNISRIEKLFPNFDWPVAINADLLD